MRSFGKGPSFHSELYALHVSFLHDIAAELSIPTRCFTVLIACDSEDLPLGEIRDCAKALIEKGAVYVCCWGNGCGRFHDIVDEVWVGCEKDGKYSAVAKDSTLMTTWHDRESLDDALWYLLFTAWPPVEDESEFYPITAVTVGDENWAGQIARRLTDIRRFNDEMLDEG
jgi:hypothetical protein